MSTHLPRARSGQRIAAGALALLAMCAVLASSTNAARLATAQEKQRIAAEVRLTLSILADSPDTGILHGTGILLAPICLSTADPRYGVTGVVPFRNGRIGEPGYMYLHRVLKGYRAVGGLRTGVGIGSEGGAEACVRRFAATAMPRAIT